MSELSGVLTLAHRDLIKLLRDRTRIVADFSFPLIFIGILGTTLQVAFGVILGVPFSLPVIVSLLPALLLIAIYGGAFGVLVLSRLDNQRQANQIFPFVMLPQFFLAGVFNPIMNLPLPLEILSRLSPMRYAVDVMRDIFYTGTQGVALESLSTNLIIIAVEFVLFMVIGTAGFVRAERNR